MSTIDFSRMIESDYEAVEEAKRRYGEDPNYILMFPPYRQHLDELLANENLNWPKTKVLKVIKDLRDDSTYTLIEIDKAHNHKLKIIEVRQYTILYGCDTCKGTIAYDKFAIRRAVMGGAR